MGGGVGGVGMGVSKWSNGQISKWPNEDNQKSVVGNLMALRLFVAFEIPHEHAVFQA